MYTIIKINFFFYYSMYMDATKNQLSRIINDRQRYLNQHNNNNLKTDRINIIVEKTNKRQERNSTQHKKYMNRNLADIQKQQIQLRKLQAADNLIKDRIQEEQNLLNNSERFPFGKENVNISQDVLQRYKGNYDQQSRILQKFRMQAELMKKTSRNKGSKFKPFQWHYRQDKNDNRLKQLELKRMRQTIQKQHQQQRQLRQFQKKQMKNIAQALSKLTNQLHDNSFTLQKGIRDLQKRLKPQSRIPTIPFPKKPQYRDIIDLQLSSNKIPVIVYQNKPQDARLYFSDIFKNATKVKKQEQNNGNIEQYKQIVKVLNQNNQRLRYLRELDQDQRYTHKSGYI